MSPPARPPTPPLRHGDQLPGEEFERRYNAMPELKKAELLQGMVFIDRRHGQFRFATARAALISWLGSFAGFTPFVGAAANVTLRLDDANEPQPDAAVYLAPGKGGRSRVDAEGFLTGAPELVADASPFAGDIAVKRSVYRRFGVREYLFWDVEQGTLEWSVLRGGQYHPLSAGPDGLLRSEIYPGLWLDPRALIGDEPLRVLAVLQQGLASSEHAAFVAALQQAAP